jgi:hypothetical protein
MSESREEAVGRSTFSQIQTLVPVSLAKNLASLARTKITSSYARSPDIRAPSYLFGTKAGGTMTEVFMAMCRIFQ